MIHSVDHPLINVGQAIVIVSMIRLFFAIRLTPFPMPQLVLGFSVSMLANMVARVTNAKWFYITDIIMWGCFGAVVIAAVFTVLHSQAEAKKLSTAKGETAPVRVSGFFDRWQIQFTWGGAMLVGGILLYGYLKTYLEKEDAKLDKVVAVTKENTNAKKEVAKQLDSTRKEQRAFTDTILKTVDTLKKTSAALMDGQTTIMQGVKSTGTLIEKRSAQTRKTIREQGAQAQP
ncbi:hypothetical protein [Fibrella forsythiae]|uniref:Uncharacterized protein n=1 Tax=Fibrella forsythiae TaxID=2817061 RepID=A0ABS3JBC3_9BACT|nr:hypothetical protein [Fibrella forsythiae]MBO0947291.1 hypothetical protein [Fibrella forsythiae]